MLLALRFGRLLRRSWLGGGVGLFVLVSFLLSLSSLDCHFSFSIKPSITIHFQAPSLPPSPRRPISNTIFSSIEPDLWGRGYTSSPHHPLDSRLLALQLLFAASSSPLPWCTSPFSIIGFSLGGSIALDFTASFPHLVRSVALLAPAGMLRELPGEYADLKRGFGEGVEGEGLRELVKRAVGVRDVDGGDGDGQVEEEGFERLARWQFEEHEGFAGSFASSLFYGPVMGQGETWRAACGVLRGKRSMGVKEGDSGERLVVVCAAEDSVVRPGDVRQDLEGFMEGEELVFETLPGGHGFLADGEVCRSVVDIVGREWGF